MKVSGIDGSTVGLRLAGWLFGARKRAASAERDGRIAASLLLAAACYSAVVFWTVGDSSQRAIQLVLLGSYAVGSATCFALPWRRLPDWAHHVVSAGWLLLLTLGAGAIGGVLSAYVVGYLLVFLYAGLTSRPLAVVGLAVLAEAALVLAMTAGNQADNRTSLAASIIVAAGVSQLAALAVVWSQIANELLVEVRRSLLELDEVDSEEEAANRIAGLFAHLIDADAALVMATEHPGSTVYVRRGGHAPASQLADIRVDIAEEQSGIAVIARTGEPLFVADAPNSTVVSRRLIRQLGATSVLYLPLPGEGGVLGGLIAWWRAPRQEVDPYARQLAEVTAIPAGLVLQRLRQAGRLDSPAMRDPLTGVSNRRRFDIALADLPVGGTVLLFDLDAFAALNDMYGREVGDEALRAFAEALRRSVRQNDVVARFGDDTFAVVLPASASSIASGIIIERLQRAWRSPQGCRFSVGVAVRTDDESPAETLTRASADLRTTKRLKTR
ncbi:MAG: diguanylate cyclase [Micromonosporaceae bacterium]|nr:diguanylate cyclase [Micromonosporaceae bacterium]